jgi:hypothetical protein
MSALESPQERTCTPAATPLELASRQLRFSPIENADFFRGQNASSEFFEDRAPSLSVFKKAMHVAQEAVDISLGFSMAS